MQEFINYIETYINNISFKSDHIIIRHRYYGGKDMTENLEQEFLWAKTFLVSIDLKNFNYDYLNKILDYKVTIALNVSDDTMMQFNEYTNHVINKYLYDKSIFFDGLALTDESLKQKYIFNKCFLGSFDERYFILAEKYSKGEIELD